MSGDVVALPGTTFTDRLSPNPAVIERLEETLARAKLGEVRAVAIATAEGDLRHSIHTAYASDPTATWAMACAVEQLRRRVGSDLIDIQKD